MVQPADGFAAFLSALAPGGCHELFDAISFIFSFDSDAAGDGPPDSSMASSASMAA